MFLCQCFDAFDWVTGRVSGLSKVLPQLFSKVNILGQAQPGGTWKNKLVKKAEPCMP